MRFVASIAAALSILAAGCTSGAVDAQKSTTHTITIDGTRFQPNDLTVKLGDTVIWVNKDPFPHTATSTGAFDSGEIASDKSWTFKADSAGEFPYICTLHRSMKGTLRVK